MKPLLKWAGGKTQLLPILKEKMPSSYNSYYEPFVGAAAMLLDIKPKNAYISDINAQLINMYKQIRDNCELVIKLIDEIDSKECNKELYLQNREIYNKKIVNGLMDEMAAALLIWINKHCFNGLYRVNKSGLFNVPYNNKVGGRSIDKQNVLEISAYLQNVKIAEQDFEDTCSSVGAHDFVYFDSPYAPISETANFSDYTKEGFSIEDHERLARLFKHLDTKGAYLMLSNNDVPFIRALYNGYNIESVKVNRMINCKGSSRRGEELIITNY